jgi:hypothetical protein
MPANIGAAGGLFLICGVVLMTTFKWTEVALKISGLEVKLAEAENEARMAQSALTAIKVATSPEGKKQSLDALLANYRQLSNTDPTASQLADFERALDSADVTIVPVQALGAINQRSTDTQND